MSRYIVSLSECSEVQAGIVGELLVYRYLSVRQLSAITGYDYDLVDRTLAELMNLRVAIVAGLPSYEWHPLVQPEGYYRLRAEFVRGILRRVLPSKRFWTRLDRSSTRTDVGCHMEVDELLVGLTTAWIASISQIRKIQITRIVNVHGVMKIAALGWRPKSGIEVRYFAADRLDLEQPNRARPELHLILDGEREILVLIADDLTGEIAMTANRLATNWPEAKLLVVLLSRSPAEAAELRSMPLGTMTIVAFREDRALGRFLSGERPDSLCALLE